MQPKPRCGAGGAGNAPCNPKDCPKVTTAGAVSIAQKMRDQQSPHLSWVAERLQRQYGLQACFAKLYAEERCAHV